MQSFKDIDEYIANFEGETKKQLETVRKTIKDVVPAEATEKISYSIPTFYLNGNLVHFAGYKTHIGFYPGSTPIAEFEKDLKGYKTSKGTVQFSHDKPLPLGLISKITKACVARNKTKNK
jgi:uncharacterized protein YdhG (YjbR/CyaY superfamily)